MGRMGRPFGTEAVAYFLLVFGVFSLAFPFFVSPLLERYNPARGLLDTPLPMAIDLVVGAGYNGPSFIAYQLFYSQFPADTDTEGLAVASIFLIGIAAFCAAAGLLLGHKWGRRAAMGVALAEISFAASLVTVQTYMLLPTLAYSSLLLAFLALKERRKRVL